MVIKRTVTEQEFDEFVMLPENADRMFELIAGEIVEVVSNPNSSRLGMKIGARITIFVDEHDLGYVTGADGGYIVAGERYIPDAAFVSKAKYPVLAEDGYNPYPPDLAVEVLSPSNTDTEMRIKVVNYLRAGTTLWVADPNKKQIEVYSPKHPPKTLGIDGVLDGGDVLPGFTLAVREIFPA
jgi:Uma2 family endonuclease